MKREDGRINQMSFKVKVFIIGIVGGFLWSLVGYFAYYFNFISVGPSLVLSPFALGEWKNENIGQWVSIGVITLLSIGIAYLYMMILKKWVNLWIGIGFGIVLWVIVFVLLNPYLHSLKPLNEIGKNSIITSICLYILYGSFIGYSVSYQYEKDH